MTIETTISAEFPFRSHYVEVHDAKMHYVDEGAGDPILFLHGNPTSAYLWRNIIPHLSPFARCIAPDLIGMGRSDKPESNYRFYDHAKYIAGLIETLDLRKLTLVLHDWGSALGFHYAAHHPEQINGLAFMEAILQSMPSWELFDPKVRELFQAFRTPTVGWQMLVDQNMFIEQVLPGNVIRKLTDEEMHHYRQPFLDPASRKPIWRWPNELPIAGEPADVVAVVDHYHAWLQQTALPKLLVYGTPGALIPAPVVAWCQQKLKNLQVVNIGPARHYLQEDNPHGIGSALAIWYKKLSEDQKR